MKRIVLKTGIIALLLFGLSFGKGNNPVYAEASQKIGLIDMQASLNSSESGKRAMAKLKREFEKKVQFLRDKEKAIKELEEKINLQGMMLKEDERKEIEEKYYRKIKELERFKEDGNAEMQKRERELTKKILGELISIARKIGQENAYTLIMEKGPSVLFSVDSIDITKQVIKRYDEEKKVK